MWIFKSGFLKQSIGNKDTVLKTHAYELRLFFSRRAVLKIRQKLDGGPPKKGIEEIQYNVFTLCQNICSI